MARGINGLLAFFIGGAFALTVAGAAASGPPPEPFYAATPDELVGKPGSIIRSEQFGDVVWGAKSYRVLYRSVGLDEKPIAVSAVVIVPDAKAPDGGLPVIAWAHPTTGIARDCAPSLRGEGVLMTIPGFKEMIEFGFVVAATDYPGLGTAGEHPYLVGVSEARAVLDSVRAARELAGAGERFAVWGHSQGGHAALWTGELAAEYAPELKLVAVAAAAPASELGALFEDDLSTVAGEGLTALTVEAWSRIYGAPVDEVVLPDALSDVAKIGAECLTKFTDLVEDERAIKGLGRKFLKADPVTTPPWKGFVSTNTPGNKAAGAPVFISQGSADTIVDPPVTINFAEKLCAQGATVAFLEVPGIAHDNIARRTGPEAVSWIADRFAGKPAQTNCIR
jgi:acetyl esterase/lipase